MWSVPRSFVLVLGVLATTLLTHAKLSVAQGWPQRAVKFVVSLGAGSGVDIGTRLLGDRLSTRWSQPVVVENRPGGDGIVAITSFLSAHDDHILLASPTSSFTAHPYLHDNLPYKASDLQTIARVWNTFITVAVPGRSAYVSPRSLGRLDTRISELPFSRQAPGLRGGAP